MNFKMSVLKMIFEHSRAKALVCAAALAGCLNVGEVAAQGDPGKGSVNVMQSSVGVSPGARSLVIKLPERIPAQCVNNAARRYQVPEMALLAILKQESGGRTGVVANNKNGSKDYGPAQFNDRSWGRYMQKKYGISLNRLTNDMCQAIMAQAYALRSEWNRCITKKKDPSIWCAIALYHSPTKKYQEIYVRNVWKRYQEMVAKGKF